MLPEALLETLPNGVKTVLVPDDHSESVAFGLFAASGSRHEKPSQGGISHFIEHMLFKGTATRSALDLSRAVEGQGGSFNAYTSECGTCYFDHLPWNRLSTAIDVMVDMYRNATIPGQEFDRERRVILEEIKMYDDEPDSVASENLSRCLFPSNALGMPVTGSAKTLSGMRPDTLRKHVERAYCGANTVAVLCGRFDPGDAAARLADALGDLPRGRPMPYKAVAEDAPVLPEARASRDIRQVQLAVGYRTFGAMDRRRFAAAVFDALMGRSMSSRLFQSVREKRGLCYDIHSALQFFNECGGWTVQAGVDSARAGAALKVIDAELDRVRQKRPSASEIRRTKDYLLGNFRISFERPRARLFYYGNVVQSFGKIVTPEETIRAIEAVGIDDVLSVARDILDARFRAVSWVTPKTADSCAFQSTKGKR